jgi:hypothetical protein
MSVEQEVEPRVQALIQDLEKFLTAHTDSLPPVTGSYVQMAALARCIAKHLLRVSEQTSRDSVHQAEKALEGLGTIPWRAVIYTAQGDLLSEPRSH